MLRPHDFATGRWFWESHGTLVPNLFGICAGIMANEFFKFLVGTLAHVPVGCATCFAAVTTTVSGGINLGQLVQHRTPFCAKCVPPVGKFDPIPSLMSPRD